jgi:ribosome-interacting GTPase 1
VEDELRRATEPAERLEKLRELFRLLPKHKGTEKLQAELKQKIARAKDEIESGKHGGKKHGMSYKVPREGAGQVVLLGGPNVGKSALLAALSHAHPEVAAYPFTTRVPQPGMMMVDDVGIQLVDLPPVTEEVMEPWIGSIARAADFAWLVAGLADDAVVELAEAVLERMEAIHTPLVAERPHDEESESTIHLPAFLVANQSDAAGADDRLEILRELLGARLPIHVVSAVDESGLDAMRRSTYDSLGVLRIYTKQPGKPADRTHPFTLPIGSTVLDLARTIHRDLENQLKFAKLWGRTGHDGQTVGKDHALSEGDVVELHT